MNYVLFKFIIKHIFEEGELDKNSVVRKFRTTEADGKEYEVSHDILEERFENQKGELILFNKELQLC